MTTALTLRVRRESTADGLRLTSTLDGGGASSEVWWQVPQEWADAISPTNDFALVTHFFHAMRLGGKLRVEGPVSPSLLANLEELNACWVRWRPAAYRGVRVEAAETVELAPAGDGPEAPQEAICSFSGGVDSCYTLWRHIGPGVELPQATPVLWRRRRITAALFVHGFDVPLAEGDGYQAALANARRLLDAVQVKAVSLTTNFRRQPLGYWEDDHGAALAAAMHLVDGRFAVALIAGGASYDHLRFPWGSTPVTDPLFSSARQRIIHDACEAGRIDKCRGLLSWPEALRYLRVCWEGADRDRNCGRCEKCIRTMLAFRVAGGRDLPCFPGDVSDQAIAALRIRSSNLPTVRALIADAEAAGYGRSSWVQALREAARASHPLNRLPLWSRWRAKLALGARIRRLFSRDPLAP